MEFTPALLIYLGFDRLHDQNNIYSYKGITGQLVSQIGKFYFQGYSQTVSREMDLRFMLMLIDYQPDESLPSFDVTLN